MEELRQAVEAALLENHLSEDVQVVSTGCLGPCASGHVMGYTQPGKDLLMFTGINDARAVRDLIKTMASDRDSDRRIPVSLRDKLEAVLPDRSRSELPVKAIISERGESPHDA